MNNPSSEDNQLKFVIPDPYVHAPITLSWFEAEYGRETLLLMGNAETEIEEPSLETERTILSDFLELKDRGKQLTWMLSYGGVIMGVAWIELDENHGVNPPSVHLMIGNKSYRGKGIGTSVMTSLIAFIRKNFDYPYVYSRHLSSNSAVARMNKSLGFKSDGEQYADNDGLVWQNVKLPISF